MMYDQCPHGSKPSDCVACRYVDLRKRTWTRPEPPTPPAHDFWPELPARDCREVQP